MIVSLYYIHECYKLPTGDRVRHYLLFVVAFCSYIVYYKLFNFLKPIENDEKYKVYFIYIICETPWLIGHD